MKNGFKVMDSDLHTMEPDGLWERYLEEPFKRFAPRFTRGTEHAPNQPVIRIGDLEIGEMSRRPRTAVVGRELQERACARHPHYAIAHARGYDAESHVQAMDIEGIDLAVIYGTRGRQVLMHDDLDPEVAAALARAHKTWTHDYCQCYVATDADEKPLRQVIEAIGDDNIVVSTDYPHSDGLFPRAIEEFVHLEGVSDKSKAKILWDNCARFYNLAASR